MACRQHDPQLGDKTGKGAETAQKTGTNQQQSPAGSFGAALLKGHNQAQGKAGNQINPKGAPMLARQHWLPVVHRQIAQPGPGHRPDGHQQGFRTAAHGHGPLPECRHILRPCRARRLIPLPHHR